MNIEERSKLDRLITFLNSFKNLKAQPKYIWLDFHASEEAIQILQEQGINVKNIDIDEVNSEGIRCKLWGCEITFES